MATKDQSLALNRLVAVLLATAGPSLAQSTPSPAPTSDWQYSLGVAVIVAPKSIGSDKTRYLAVPTFEIKYKDLGVNAQQAAASGLPPFNAESGVQRAGAFVQSAYRISDEWTAFGRLESTRLRGDAAGSPVVERKGQTSILLSVLKAF
jgi:outer membrane scaffolding protein for murein synthesis (MipA/OmpV family)